MCVAKRTKRHVWVKPYLLRNSNEKKQPHFRLGMRSHLDTRLLTDDESIGFVGRKIVFVEHPFFPHASEAELEGQCPCH